MPSVTHHKDGTPVCQPLEVVAQSLTTYDIQCRGDMGLRTRVSGMAGVYRNDENKLFIGLCQHCHKEVTQVVARA